MLVTSYLIYARVKGVLRCKSSTTILKGGVRWVPLWKRGIKKKLILVDGEQVYGLKYKPGEEDYIREVINALEQDKNLPFNWLDAAVLRHQLEQQEREAGMEVPDKAA